MNGVLGVRPLCAPEAVIGFWGFETCRRFRKLELNTAGRRRLSVLTQASIFKSAIDPLIRGVIRLLAFQSRAGAKKIVFKEKRAPLFGGRCGDRHGA